MLTRLTPAQYEAAAMWCAGLRITEIARRRGVSQSCVSNLIHRACSRLQVDGRRALARAMESCEIGVMPRGQRSKHGFVAGDAVLITGGRFAGRAGMYVGRNNSDQIRIQVGGGVFALRVGNLVRVEPGADNHSERAS